MLVLGCLISALINSDRVVLQYDFAFGLLTKLKRIWFFIALLHN